MVSLHFSEHLHVEWNPLSAAVEAKVAWADSLNESFVRNRLMKLQPWSDLLWANVWMTVKNIFERDIEKKAVFILTRWSDRACDTRCWNVGQIFSSDFSSFVCLSKLFVSQVPNGLDDKCASAKVSAPGRCRSACYRLRGISVSRKKTSDWIASWKLLFCSDGALDDLGKKRVLDFRI